MTLENAAQTTTGSDEAEAAPDEIRDPPLPEVEGETPALDIRLPADLANISAQFQVIRGARMAAQHERRAALIDIVKDADEEQNGFDEDMQRLLDATLRRLQVTEELLRRERAITNKLHKAVDAYAALARDDLRNLETAADETAAEAVEASDYERMYREQYEHEPEPRDPGTPDPAADLERSLMMPPATSSVQVHYEALTDDKMPAFLRNLSRTDTFDEADVWAEPETPSRMIARGFRNLRAILDAMRNPFRQATPSRRIA